MGNWLSGRRPLHPSDDLCDCIVLDAGSLQKGRSWWEAPRHKSGASQDLVQLMGISRSGDRGHIQIRISGLEGGERAWKTQQIRLQALPANFGGLRWYFVCPVTMKRRVKLYLPFGCSRFASRQAYGLVYQIGRENGLDRAHRKLGTLFAKLGLDYDGPDSVFPRRPKGMHRRTFERIEHQIAATEDRLEIAYEAGLSRIFARSSNFL